MANLRIVPLNWFDDVLAANLTASSEVAGMEVENAQLVARSKVWRSTATGAVTIDGTWGGDGRKCSAFALFRHNTHGGTVRLQLYSDAAWTTGVYDSTALTVSSTALGDFDWGTDPLGTTSDDPLLYEAPYVIYFTPTTAASFRITLGGTPANGAAYWEIGRIWLGKYWEAATNMAPGMEIAWVQDDEQRRSRGGSLRSSSGAARWRALTLDLAAVSEGDRQTLMDLRAQVGRKKDVVVSAFPALGGRLERDYTLDAKFVAAEAIAYHYAFKSTRLALEEV
jgi:hypothetical protein